MVECWKQALDGNGATGAPWNTGAEATPDKLVGSGGSVVGTEYAHLADIGDWELAKERSKQ